MEQGAVAASIKLTHPHGLHLRVGRDVALVANRFDAEITAQNLTRPSPVVDAKSLVQLMQLQARTGHVLRVQAAGPDAQEALRALCQLFEEPPHP
jgi:phosphotransferase system HPr (HPr) family protein